MCHKYIHIFRQGVKCGKAPATHYMAHPSLGLGGVANRGRISW